MFRHLKTCLATFGPLMLMLTMAVLFRFGLALEMLR